MGFPTLEATTESAETSDTTTHTVSYDEADGELIVIWLGFSASGGTIGTVPTGWNRLTPTGQLALHVFWKIHDSDGSSVDFTTSESERSWAIARNYTDFDAGEVPEIDSGGGAGGTDGSPDPPANTWSWGSADTLVTGGFNGFGGEADDDDWATAPTDYGNLAMKTSGTTSFAFANAYGAIADMEVTAASENPGAFDISEDSTTWRAATVAIKGADVGGGVTDPVADILTPFM